MKNKLRWTITAVGAAAATWSDHVDGDTHTGKGATTTATYTGMPANNGDFGLKTVTLTISGVAEFSRTTNVEVFFTRDATNHPGGQAGSPNWFHYWSQTSAATGQMVYTSATAIGGWTSWDAPDYTAHVDDEAATIYPTPDVGRNANITLYGIDTFAWTVRHEWRHHDQMDTWWGAGGWVPASDADEGSGDGIPDNLEPGLGGGSGGPFDNTRIDTHTNDSLDNDMEREAVFTQDDWDVGSANHQDWGRPGMQHRTINYYND